MTKNPRAGDYNLVSQKIYDAQCHLDLGLMAATKGEGGRMIVQQVD
jgi:hypothetical protein